MPILVLLQATRSFLLNTHGYLHLNLKCKSKGGTDRFDDTFPKASLDKQRRKSVPCTTTIRQVDSSSAAEHRQARAAPPPPSDTLPPGPPPPTPAGG